MSDNLGGCRHFQLGYVVRAIEPAIASFEALGARRIDLISDMRDHAGNEVMILHLSHLRLGETEIELIERRPGWDSVYTGYPFGQEEISFHHVGFMAASNDAWEKANTQLKSSGAIVAMAIDLPQVRVAYYDTRKRLGHFLEIVQRRAGQPDR